MLFVVCRFDELFEACVGDARHVAAGVVFVARDPFHWVRDFFKEPVFVGVFEGAATVVLQFGDPV